MQQKANYNALIRACKYSYITNNMKYCGAKNANKAFLKLIKNPNEITAKKAEDFFPSFEALWPYLNLIAKQNNLIPLDKEVIDAYWIGNDLLENISIDAMKDVILNEFSGSLLLPKLIAKRKAEGVPIGILPSHSFHVLYVNFITGKVEPLRKNLDKCLIHSGVVLEIKKDSLILDSHELLFKDEKFKLEKTKRKIEKGFIENPKIGETVSFHWNYGIEKLSQRQKEQLDKYTKINLKAVNKSNLSFN